MTQLIITPDKYVIKDRLKICRIDGDELVFFDRQPRRRKNRSREQGEADVRVNVLDLVRAIAAARG